MNEKYIHQRKIFKERRKELRNSPTEAEYLLWQGLKSSKLGYKFTRQHSGGPYILDFYCPKLKLAVEVDGGVHQNLEAKEYDKDRDKYLQSGEIKVIRFWNFEVVENLQKVLKEISESAKERSVTPS
jgi:very-short-patch-repair endonuclease